MVVKTNKIKFDSDKNDEVVEGEGVFDLGNLTAKSAEIYKKKKDPTGGGCVSISPLPAHS